MKHLARQNSPHRRRRIHHNRFPYVRFATVRAENKRSPFSPSLLLRGDWLTEAGFLPHWRVRITVQAQRLVVEPLLGAGMGDSSSPVKPLACPMEPWQRIFRRHDDAQNKYRTMGPRRLEVYLRAHQDVPYVI
jgi:hypothetical protein